MGTNRDHGSTGIKRRAVLHAGWAVPVVVAVTAAPAMALSQPVFIDTVSDSCKYPGQSIPGKEFGYHMVVVFHADFAGTVHIDSLSTSKNPTTDITPSTFPLAAGNTTVAFDVFSSASANMSTVITYTFTASGGGTPQTFSQSVTFPSFNPCKK
jgi:hypothetical protein